MTEYGTANDNRREAAPNVRVLSGSTTSNSSMGQQHGQQHYDSPHIMVLSMSPYPGNGYPHPILPLLFNTRSHLHHQDSFSTSPPTYPHQQIIIIICRFPAAFHQVLLFSALSYHTLNCSLNYSILQQLNFNQIQMYNIPSFLKNTHPHLLAEGFWKINDVCDKLLSVNTKVSLHHLFYILCHNLNLK
jgi:hypothetical protein